MCNLLFIKALMCNPQNWTPQIPQRQDTCCCSEDPLRITAWDNPQLHPAYQWLRNHGLRQLRACQVRKIQVGSLPQRPNSAVEKNHSIHNHCLNNIKGKFTQLSKTFKMLTPSTRWINISGHNEVYRLFWCNLPTFLHLSSAASSLGDKISTPINNSLDYDTARKTVPAHHRWPFLLNMTNSVCIYQLFQLPMASKQLDAPPGPKSYLAKQTQELQNFVYTCFDVKKIKNSMPPYSFTDGSTREWI